MPPSSGSSSLDGLPDWARDLLATARVARLGLLDAEDRPRVLPVTYAVAGAAVWTAVDHKPKSRSGDQLARVRWLRRNPAAAVTVDRYSDDWERLAWVQLLGRVDVLAAPQPDAVAALAARYEQYRERPPAGPFLRLAVERALCWSSRSGT